MGGLLRQARERAGGLSETREMARLNQAVQAAAHYDGSGYAVVDLRKGNTVTLTGIAAAQPHMGDFIL